jgi:hypothetical protein
MPYSGRAPLGPLRSHSMLDENDPPSKLIGIQAACPSARAWRPILGGHSSSGLRVAVALGDARRLPQLDLAFQPANEARRQSHRPRERTASHLFVDGATGQAGQAFDFPPAEEALDMSASATDQLTFSGFEHFRTFPADCSRLDSDLDHLLTLLSYDKIGVNVSDAGETVFFRWRLLKCALLGEPVLCARASKRSAGDARFSMLGF